MTIDNSIENKYSPLEDKMSGQEALELLRSSGLSELPVLSSSTFKGSLSIKVLEGLAGKVEEIIELEDKFSMEHLDEDMDIVEALKLINSKDLSSMPVIDEEGNCLGVVTRERLWEDFSRRTGMLSEGSWITMSMKRSDFQFSEIAQIVESHNLMIIFHFVEFFEGIDRIEVNIKINKENINELVQTLQRYEYNVVKVNQPKKFEDDWDDRFDQLMRFFST